MEQKDGEYNMQIFIKSQIEESCSIKQKILMDDKLTSLIKTVSKVIIKAYKRGNKTLIAGNGGSAADAQHIAGELVSKLYFDRPGLPSIALTTDSSIMTAIGNDYGYEKLFARQIKANGINGDIFIGISTSGNSANILEALTTCKNIGLTTVGLTGQNSCKMDDFCDYCIKVPSNDTPRIQESHILIAHIICSVVEEAMFGKRF